ncbi:MAG: hypothetical protein OXU65_05695 [Deltaproteobacteria bacterium]|nr:hypothetical protein [Deltaproteobacteria bacterium]
MKKGDEMTDRGYALGLEEERQQLLQNMNRIISPELKAMIDLAYQLARKEPPKLDTIISNRSTTDA